MIPSYLYKVSFPTGSNYICNPPVTDTDIDQMFLVYDLYRTAEELDQLGWKECRSKDNKSYPTDVMLAFRLGVNNALLTDNEEYFNNFYKATEEAKRRNLLNKADRIALFEEYIGKKEKSTLESIYITPDTQVQTDFNVILNDMLVQQNRAHQAFTTNNGINVLVNTLTAA